MNWFCGRLLDIEQRGKRIVIEADGTRYSIDRYSPHQGADLTHGWIADGRLSVRFPLGTLAVAVCICVSLWQRHYMFTGTISYGLYLLHKFPVDFLKALRPHLHPTVAFLVAVPAAYLLAILSWNLLEKPFLKLKALFENVP